MFKEIVREIRKDIHNNHQKSDDNLNLPEGLSNTKKVTYWDYVKVDTLLSLQEPKTDFKDEVTFILYHQLTEIVMKMILHEVEQISGQQSVDINTLSEKIDRLNRYLELLINSFDIMRYGLNYEDYNQFRKSLIPASGFQSVQFRLIELRCTRLENLLDQEGKKIISNSAAIQKLFKHIYWKSAGVKPETGEKTDTLSMFEDKYIDQLIDLAEQLEGHTLEDKIMDIGSSLSPILNQALRRFDYLFNVKWPLVHLNTAEYFLNTKGEEKVATGGSNWKKYLHPKYQQRRFFPLLWSEDEIKNWGKCSTK